MNQLSTYSWTFDEDVLRYRKAGYDAIGIWRCKLSDFGEQRGIELLRDANMKVSNLIWAGGFTGCDGRSFEESVDDGLDAIRLAAELSSECLVVYTGSRSGHTNNHARRISRRAMDQLIPNAERLGVQLALAPVHKESCGEWTFLHQLKDVVDFVESIDAPTVRVAFDTYQLGHTLPGFKQIEAIARHVAIVHVGDARRPPSGEMNCCLINEGSVPIALILAALRNGGFDGYCDVKLLGEDVELHPYEHVLEHSLQALNQIDRALQAN